MPFFCIQWGIKTFDFKSRNSLGVNSNIGQFQGSDAYPSTFRPYRIVKEVIVRQADAVFKFGLVSPT
jgi:hypothetical protein